MSFIADTDFPLPGETAVCPEYTFDPTRHTIRVDKPDFLCFLLVVNITRGQVLFNPTKPALTGRQTGAHLLLELDTSTMDSSDHLLIIAAVDRHSYQHELLNKISDQLIKTNLLLEGILES